MVREVPLTPQQNKYYVLLKEQMLVQAAGETITAVNAAAGVSKLLQISCGAAYTEGERVSRVADASIMPAAPRIRAGVLPCSMTSG